MTHRAVHALGVSIVAAVLVGCAADPPADLDHLPRDATAIWGVDAGKLAAWPGASGPGPLRQLGSEAWKEGIVACGLDLAALDVVGAGTDPADLVIVLRAPEIGDTSTLSCLGAGAWRDQAEAWWTVEGAELHGTDETVIGRVIAPDAVVIATDPAAHDLDALAEGSKDPWGETLREALAEVDYRAAIWGAVVPSAVDGEESAEPQSVAFDVAVADDLVVHARVRTGDADAMAQTIEAELREVAGWVYAPPAVVDDAEIEAGDGRVQLRLSIAPPQWQGMDLRWIDERRGLVPPKPEADATSEPPEVAQSEQPAVELPAAEAVAVAVGPTGIAGCDEYIRKYRACIDDKMPASVREASSKALDQTVEAWKAAAATPAARSALEEACKAASAAVEQATAAMGCSW